MKVRRGFVTNSSSSSFLVAYNDLNILDDDVLEKYTFLRNYMGILDDAITKDGKIASTEKQLYEMFLHEIFCGDYKTLEEAFNDYGEYWKEVYDKATELIEKGYCISYNDFDNYEDEKYIDIITQVADDNKIILLAGD